MKLASLKTEGRDGRLVVVSRDLSQCVPVPDIAPSLQAALDDWGNAAPRIDAVYERLNEGAAAGARPFDPLAAASPLPRAYQFVDGSAYVHHIQRVHKSRGGVMPESFWTDPSMYQTGSDSFVGPRDPMLAADEAWGLDFEAEVAVITDDVPMGVDAAGAAGHIVLFMLLNDFSLRNLIVAEKAKGTGFLQCKPTSAFSPVAASPGELGAAWDGGRLHLPLVTHVNGALVGQPDCAQDMTFDFPTLVAHAAKTRALGAGTIIGSGPVSNDDHAKGFSSLTEKRILETIEDGVAKTPFLSFGDRVRIEMFSADGSSIFGAIDQEAARYKGP